MHSVGIFNRDWGIETSVHCFLIRTESGILLWLLERSEVWQSLFSGGGDCVNDKVIGLRNPQRSRADAAEMPTWSAFTDKSYPLLFWAASAARRWYRFSCGVLADAGTTT
jgi:hypothetical protein